MQLIDEDKNELHMWAGEGIVNYYAGMILCGVGWNFSFSAGTVMLMGSYRPEEATDVQAFNDFVLFSIAGGGSLASGIVFADYGWTSLIYVVAIVVVLNTGLFLVSWRIKNQLEQERTASNLYQAINPAVIEKALEGDTKPHNQHYLSLETPGHLKKSRKPLEHF